DRLHCRDAARPQRQALQAQAARPLLGGPGTGDLMPLPRDAHDVYRTDDPPEDGPRARRHELVRQTKRAIEDIALLDIERTGMAELDALVDAARALADKLEPLPSLREKGGAAMARGPDAALLERSGITGRSNPLAAPLHLWSEGELTRGWAVYSAPYEGPPGCLHGGFVAAAFDDLLGWAQIASGRAGFTVTLTIKKHQ